METLIINGFRQSILTGDDTSNTIIFLSENWNNLSGHVRLTIKRELSAYLTAWETTDCHLEDNLKQQWIDFYNQINKVIIPRFDEYIYTEKSINTYMQTA